MTDRLYYLDPYLRAFDATIEHLEARGGLVAVRLDRTAFYPTSGGQPFDTGRLGPARVVDVVDEEDGSIAHLVEAVEGAAAPALKVGAPVHGAIDWPRRFDHMQQHSGQHVLSAAFARLSGVRTVSFHLGATVSTIDLAREMSSTELAAAENEANRIVWEDRPVAIRFASAEEAAAMPLRKEPARAGTLRLIDVEDFDLSACGGSHVSRTGAIGIITIASWERFKGGQRLSFLCGGRALESYRALRDSVAGAVRMLSVLPAELPQTIERMQSEAKGQQRTLAALQAELARYRSDELAESAEEISLDSDVSSSAGRTARLVAQAVDADAPGLKSLASAIVSRPGYIVVLVSSAGPPAVAVIARSADVNLAAQKLLLMLHAAFGGRGGGKPDFAQGGGLNASPLEILDAARAAITARR
jgi:alanyl-tRNA synthetase